jgi:hypothetical protein
MLFSEPNTKPYAHLVVEYTDGFIHTLSNGSNAAMKQLRLYFLIIPCEIGICEIPLCRM